MSKTEEDQDQQKRIDAARWIMDMPDEDILAEACILIYMKARNATSEDTALSSEEAELFTEYALESILAVKRLRSRILIKSNDGDLVDE